MEHLPELVEISDPDHMKPEARRLARMSAEEQKFDGDHYMTDFILDEEIQECIKFVPRWKQEADKIEAAFKQDPSQSKAELHSKIIEFDTEVRIKTLLCDDH